MVHSTSDVSATFNVYITLLNAKYSETTYRIFSNPIRTLFAVSEG